MQKQSFILKVPYYLATRAGSVWVKALLASCYAFYAFAHAVPLFGTLIASFYAIIILQILNYKLKEKKEYNIYLSFLLQRIIFYTVFVISLSIYTSQVVQVDQSIWKAGYIILTIISLSDIFYTVKGRVGVGFFYARNKHIN